MKPFIQIALNTGHVYEIPTSVIAANRAAHYHAQRPDEFPTLEAATEDTAGFFDDAKEIADWAGNNMNWDELLPNAKLIRFKPPVEQPFHEGEWTFHDTPALMGELDGATLMKQPVELVMHTMAMTGQLCNATVLHGPDGEPYGAFALIIGNHPIIQTYLNGLQFIGNQITEQQAPTPAVPGSEATH